MGHRREVGDWLTSGRFADVPGLFARIRDHGRRAGIWPAPLLVGARSELAAEHPDWLVRKENGESVEGLRDRGVPPGVELIREVIGPDAYPLGRGAREPGHRAGVRTGLRQPLATSAPTAA
ncbi:alpha-galactosidase [Allokutzneria oryzae]|uniref:Alpha-galactosidase n=1 Tax=Allokutzneria oryzae TaxID=1378989 RepID=A0ABV5ZX59_9PSEU